MSLSYNNKTGNNITTVPKLSSIKKKIDRYLSDMNYDKKHILKKFIDEKNIIENSQVFDGEYKDDLKIIHEITNILEYFEYYFLFLFHRKPKLFNNQQIQELLNDFNNVLNIINTFPKIKHNLTLYDNQEIFIEIRNTLLIIEDYLEIMVKKYKNM